MSERKDELEPGTGAGLCEQTGLVLSEARDSRAQEDRTQQVSKRIPKSLGRVPAISQPSIQGELN